VRCSAAQDVAKGRQVAIKKLDAPFATAERAKRAYRELVILQRLDHENVRLSQPAWTLCACAQLTREGVLGTYLQILKLRDVYTSEDNKELYAHSCARRPAFGCPCVCVCMCVCVCVCARGTMRLTRCADICTAGRVSIARWAAVARKVSGDRPDGHGSLQGLA
jgi:serine/threonine protein kinase